MRTIKQVAKLEKGKDRWSAGTPHHPMSEKLMEFLAEVDFVAYDDHFCWKYGGDGDNGECLMYEMDAFFEAKDRGDL